MTSTQHLSAVSDALGTAFGTAGLILEPADGLTDVPGALTSVVFHEGEGGDTTPATLAMTTSGGLDLFDAGVAALQKAMPGLVSAEPRALGSVAELDINRSGEVSYHTVSSAGAPVGLLILEQDRRAPGTNASANETQDVNDAPLDPAPEAAGGQVMAGNTAVGNTAVGNNVVGGTPVGSGASLSMLSDVMLNVTVDLGRQSLALSQVLALAVGSVVELDRAAGAPVDVRVNGILFGRGEVVVVDDEYAVRVIEIIEAADR